MYIRTLSRRFLMNETVSVSCSGIDVTLLGLLIMYELNPYTLSNPLNINTCSN